MQVQGFLSAVQAYLAPVPYRAAGKRCSCKWTTHHLPSQSSEAIFTCAHSGEFVGFPPCHCSCTPATSNVPVLLHHRLAFRPSRDNTFLPIYLPAYLPT